MPSLLVTGASEAQPANIQHSQQETKLTKKKRTSYLPETNVCTYLTVNIYNFTTIFFFLIYFHAKCPSMIIPTTSLLLPPGNPSPSRLPTPPSRAKRWSYNPLSFPNQLCCPDISFLHMPARRKIVIIIYGWDP